MSYIELNHVNLYYSSLSFWERSLKKTVFNLLRHRRASDAVEDIHALKDISLTIRQGERVALLGHNGAGKSTFLKMLAGLYPIRTGARGVDGRIRALFELSTGFECEATGRENILYRGLLMGLSPKEVRAHTQDIIEFADLGEFIDYPLKTYSAGMQVRLAFAISTYLEGEILLLDEIFGAGDINFMKKAQNRIMELIQKAQILVFATHDWETARNVCTRGLVFDHGTIRYDGPIHQSVDYYKKLMESHYAGAH